MKKYYQIVSESRILLEIKPNHLNENVKEKDINPKIKTYHRRSVLLNKVLYHYLIDRDEKAVVKENLLSCKVNDFFFICFTDLVDVRVNRKL